MGNELSLKNVNLGSAVGGTFGTILGNNPVGQVLGNGGTQFVNSIMTGQDGWTAVGGVVQKLGTDMLGMALNGTLGAIGSAFTAGEASSQNAKAENEMKQNNDKAVQATQEGVKELNKMVSDADGKIDGYNSAIAGLQGLVDEAKQANEKAASDIEDRVTAVKQEIANFETRQIEREQLKRQIESCEDENQKAQLEKQLAIKDQELEDLSTGINHLGAEIENIRTDLRATIDKANEANNEKLEIEAKKMAENEDLQVALDGVSDNINQRVSENVNKSAQSAQQLQQQGVAQVQAGEKQVAQGGVLGATGVGAIVGAAGAKAGAELITIGNGAKTDAGAGMGTLTGTVQGFGSQMASVGGAVNTFNTNNANLDTSIESFNQSFEDFTNYTENLIKETTIYDALGNDKDKDKDKKETTANA